MTGIDIGDLRDKLIADGYCVLHDILSPEAVSRLRLLVRSVMSSNQDKYLTSAPMCLTYHIAEIAELILWPKAWYALAELGITDCKYYSTVLLNSRPGEGRGGWHHDWWGWSDEKTSSRAIPPELALFYYLVPTTRTNGCLRVIPGSHRVKLAWCDQKPDEYAIADHHDEEDVEVAAGDLVLCDARVFHSRHANTTDTDRPLITIWLIPEFSKLPSDIQARVANAVGDDAVCYLPEALIAPKIAIQHEFRPNYIRH